MFLFGLVVIFNLFLVNVELFELIDSLALIVGDVSSEEAKENSNSDR